MTYNPKKRSKSTPPGWFTLAECAAIFDVKRQSFHTTYRPLIPSDCIKDDGGTKLVRVRGLIDALIDRQRARVVDDDALVFAGGDSPNLERLRAAKAELAELDLEERRGTHVELRALDGTLTRFAGHIRKAGEILQRRFGNEASDVLNAAVDEVEHLLRTEIRDRTSTTTSAEGNNQ